MFPTRRASTHSRSRQLLSGYLDIDALFQQRPGSNRVSPARPMGVADLFWSGATHRTFAGEVLKRRDKNE